jgi:hypothetical protein
LAPRALEEIVRPRRPAGVMARPLNFTVRCRVASLTYLSTKESYAMSPRPLLRVVVTLATLLGATSCALSDNDLKAVSAGHIGCAPEQMTISNRRASGGVLLWDATCNGKTYLCSQVINGKSSAEYSCAPAQ